MTVTEQEVARSAIDGLGIGGAGHTPLTATCQDLGTLGGANSEAAAINDWSQVVGVSDMPGGGTHAFLYQNGTMTDLNSILPAGSGWVLESAKAFILRGVR